MKLTQATLVVVMTFNVWGCAAQVPARPMSLTAPNVSVLDLKSSPEGLADPAVPLSLQVRNVRIPDSARSIRVFVIPGDMRTSDSSAGYYVGSASKGQEDAPYSTKTADFVFEMKTVLRQMKEAGLSISPSKLKVALVAVSASGTAASAPAMAEVRIEPTGP